MLFSSLTFLFVFLPLTLVIYFLAKDKYRNYILLIASLIFYSWGEPKYILLMLASIVVNYFLALRIHKDRKHAKAWLAIAVILDIGALFVFKYLEFFTTNLNQILHLNLPVVELVLPIGISFYTFQILSYVIDVYRKKVKVQRNIFTLGTYIALFPQLIAGPIVRYETIEKQLQKRTHSFERFCDGMRRFIVGFAKKVLIANNVALFADIVLSDPGMAEFGILPTLLGLSAYTLQIYYDFSGYSDMAIGLGKVFGFDFDENFNYPYAATSITDFWRRWHISLTTWFRDYVYIPLGGNRCSKIKWVRNFLIVWLLTGLWHGASWNFILWGLYFAAILLFEKLWFHKVLEKLPKVVRWVYMFAVVNLGWLFFRVETLSGIKAFLKSVRYPIGGATTFLAHHFSLVHYAIFLVLGLIFMFPVGKRLGKMMERSPVLMVVRDIILVVLLVLGICALIDNSYNPFIYFRF